MVTSLCPSSFAPLAGVMEEDTELEGVQTGGAMEEEGEDDLLVLDPSHVCLDIVDNNNVS